MNSDTNYELSILRELAARYYEAAASDDNIRNIMAHKRINDLKDNRPIVLIDEIPWHEMNFDGSLDCVCTDNLFRRIESHLRIQLYKWNNMRADMVLTPYIGIGKVIRSSGYGIGRINDDKLSQGNDAIQVHTFVDQISSLEDVEKLHNEVITYDKALTERMYNQVGEAIGDIIPVRITGQHGGYEIGCKIWDDISWIKSIDQIMYDMMDEPELMHALASKLTDILIDKYRQYEELNLFDTDAYYNHSASALTNDIERPQSGIVTRKNVWGRGLAQILAVVSPEMQDEFDITYQLRALEGFGLVYYGCCEPLHNKIHILEKIKNLRKISITPWADVDVAAERMGKKYVLSAKPNPAALGESILDEGALRKELTKIVNACKRNGTNCELVIKDITTVKSKPQNLFLWQKIAMEIVQQ